MAAIDLLCDTGPLVAFFNRADQHHAWAKEQFAHIFQPLKTCEAVISETIFVLQSDGLSPDPLFETLARGKLLNSFAAADYWPDLRRFIKKYENLPMSLADASLVKMSELSSNCKILTTDRHFRIYRRNERLVIPLIAPFD